MQRFVHYTNKIGTYIGIWFCAYFQPNYPGPSSLEEDGEQVNEVSNYSPDVATNLGSEKNNVNDAMIRDFNPSFQKEVEEQVLKSLKDKSSSGNNRSKLINWRILNNGEQTIIVLWLYFRLCTYWPSLKCNIYYYYTLQK